MGGSLSRPHERFPNVFGGSLWKEYPYFLPCLVASAITFVGFITTLVLFKEVCNDDEPGNSSNCLKYRSSIQTVPKTAVRLREQPHQDKPLPLRSLLTFPVVISVSNYTAHAFLTMTLLAILPLFFTMPIELGGLDFTPSLIGYILGFCGVLVGLFQVFFFSRIVRHLGERSVFNIGVRSYFVVFTAFPIMSIYARRFGVTILVWVLIGVVLVMISFMDMAYGLWLFFRVGINTKRP
jgi:hypothetical protein